MKAKVQTNDYNVNVIVETQYSSNIHISHLDKDCTIEKVLTDEEINAFGQLLIGSMSPDELLKLYKDLLIKKEGFGTSNCTRDERLYPDSPDLKYGDICIYKLD